MVTVVAALKVVVALTPEDQLGQVACLETAQRGDWYSRRRRGNVLTYSR